MVVSKLTVDDLVDITKTEQELLGNTLGLDFLKAELSNPNAYYYKISEQVLIGYVGIRINGYLAEVLNLVIKSEYQHKGYGSILMQYVFNMLKNNNIKSLVLEVRVDNLAAIKFYEKLGFHKVLEKKGYYQGIDAIIYQWENKK